jgi:hypothetical protein
MNPVRPWIYTCVLNSENNGKFYMGTRYYNCLKGDLTG